MLDRGVEGKYAKSVFFESFNDFDIYVEDTALESPKLYSILFGRALENSATIQNVFPLGGKHEVLLKWESDKEHSGRPRVFVIDGDLDLTCGEARGSERRLFVLGRYCIENYLVDEDAILNVLYEEDPVRELAALKGVFAFDDWIAKNGTELIRLFGAFAAAHKLGLGVVTVSRPVRSIVDNQFGDVSEKKVSAWIGELYEEARRLGREGEFQSLESKTSKRCCECKTGLVEFVSGKDYLLPLLFIRIRSTIKVRSDNFALKLRIARRANVEALSDICKFVA